MLKLYYDRTQKQKRKNIKKTLTNEAKKYQSGGVCVLKGKCRQKAMVVVVVTWSWRYLGLARS